MKKGTALLAGWLCLTTLSACLPVLPTGTAAPLITPLPGPLATGTPQSAPATSTPDTQPTPLPPAPPSPTPQPARAPEIDIPAHVTDLFDGFHLEKAFTFDGDWQTDWALANPQAGAAGDGILTLAGQPGWVSALSYRPALTTNQGVIVRFRFEGGYGSTWNGEVQLEKGLPGQEAYRRFGVFLAKFPAADLARAAETFPFVEIAGSSPLKTAHWYHALLTIDRHGRLLAVVWEPDAPDVYYKFVDRRGQSWGEGSYTFTARVPSTGFKLAISDFAVFSYQALH